MKIKILSGIPGSGKTTWAEAQEGAVIASADHFFLNRDFNRAEWPQAHSQCFKAALACAKAPTTDLLIIDNTNLQAWEAAPYVMLAQAYGHEMEIVRFDVDLETAKDRRKEIPSRLMDWMWEKYQNPDFPRHW